MQEKKGETGMLNYIIKFNCIACIKCRQCLYINRMEHSAEKGSSRQIITAPFSDTKI